MLPGIAVTFLLLLNLAAKSLNCFIRDHAVVLLECLTNISISCYKQSEHLPVKLL